MSILAVRSRLSLASLVLLVATGTGSAQDGGRASRLDELFNHFADNHKFMGTVAVADGGQIIFAKQYGSHLPETEAGRRPGAESRRPNEETQYRIGSITKTFTAAMIMQLVEEGKLTLETRLSDFFPDFPNADSISIRQLLGHRSGIGSITDDPTYKAWCTEQKSRDEMLQIIARQPKKFDPGARTEYSNSNYVLLGFIIEKVTDSDYAQQLKSRICDRAGLRRTEIMAVAALDQNVARSFRRKGDQWTPEVQTDPSIPGGAGAIMSTPPDLIRFAQALFGGKLVSEASLKEMMPEGLGMGNGMFAFPFGVKRALGHNGGIDGFQSNLGYFPDDDIAVAIITNGIDYTFNDIMIGMLSIVFDQPYKLPDFREVEVAEEVIKRYLGVFARDNFPLKITFTMSDGRLIAQGTGQPSFPLTASSDTEFRSDAVGAVMIFSESIPGAGFDTMLLKQAGAEIEFRKE